VLDGDFFEDHPHNLLQRGKFAQVPILIGTNSDEGASFGQRRGPNGSGINSDADMRFALRNIFTERAVHPADVVLDLRRLPLQEDAG
jgi:carboxylesterase type B